MEDPASPSQFDDSLAETITKSLASQREQVDEFLAAQREQLERTEAELAEQTQRFVQELAQNQGDADSDGDLQEEMAKSTDDHDDDRRRYEMSVEEIRELKKQVEELEDQLNRARTASPIVEQEGMLNWETQKKRIMASLENDFDDEDEQDVEERAVIKKLVEQTNQMMDAKVREIGELKQLLKDQNSSLGQVAVGAAAMGEILDNDAIIWEERENLKRTQEEWEEKLRKAEIEISIERANIARETARLTEKERMLKACSNADASSTDDLSDNASRAGRWLEQLGLQNLNEEHKG